MPSDSVTIAGTKSNARSRIGNGSALLPSVDGRSVWARLFRDTIGAIASDAGGPDRMSEGKKLLARRVAALEAELIYLEDEFASLRAEGQAPDMARLDLYARLGNAQRRHLEALGLERVPRDVDLDLATYVRRTRERGHGAS